jgi:hypothetical protein
MAFDTPILFLVFNRPATTKKVFERIREIKPSQLFVAADGPRPEKEGEREVCEEVRNIILQGVDWPCEVKTLFRNNNLGCGLAVSEGISWFFEHVEEGIILEDDTLPDPSFFNFCKPLLEKYRNDERIKMISGDNFQNGKWRGEGSYYFSAYSHIWGWASWKRVWKEYDFKLSGFTIENIEVVLRYYFERKVVIEYWTKVFQQFKIEPVDTWDYQLVFSIWRNRGLTILPNKNLVSNIGFGEFSTHTSNSKDKTSNMPVGSIIDIYHPGKVEINRKADLYFFGKYLGQKNFFEKIKNKLRITNEL